MRKLWLSKEDFELFYHEIGPFDFEFFRTHVETFKRMWREQLTKIPGCPVDKKEKTTKRFWKLFLESFEDFMWTHGSLKDLPKTLSGEDVRGIVNKVSKHINEQFINGKVASAKSFILNSALVAQNKHALPLTEKVNTATNPFFVKETREAFRSFFGQPTERDTFIRFVVGLPLYLKFAGGVIIALKRWLEAEEINEDNENDVEKYFMFIHKPAVPKMNFDIDKLQPQKSTKETIKEVSVGKSKMATSKELLNASDKCLSDDQDTVSKKKGKLHECFFCHSEEKTAKSFKRCQKCKGSAIPRYYCSKDCQAKDWKGGHKEDHFED